MAAADEPLAGALARGLRGDAGAMRELVSRLLPVVHARVMRGLWRGQRRRSQSRDLQQERDDLVQDVFATLFASDARVLRTWDESRGLSLENFVGMVAEQEVSRLLRTGKRSPWTEDATLDEDLVAVAGAVENLDIRLVSRDLLAALLDRLNERLSPRGLLIFRLLVVEERPAEEIAPELAMTVDAIYAWRARFLRLARTLMQELQGAVSSPSGRANEETIKEASR